MSSETSSPGTPKSPPTEPVPTVGAPRRLRRIGCRGSAGTGTTVAILMVIMALGIVVFFNYYMKIRRDAASGRLPMQGRVETDLGWVDQDGKERKLHDLLGKVIVFSYVYTTCPMGCAGIVDEMAKLQQEFGSNPNFHLVSISLYPEFDRPERLKAWMEARGVGGDNWWFLTSPDGSGDTVRKWMQRTFHIGATRKPQEHIDRNPADVWEHQLVMALVDGRGNIRTPDEHNRYYWPFHPAFDYSWWPRPISDDIRKLLDEASQEK